MWPKVIGYSFVTDVISLITMSVGLRKAIPYDPIILTLLDYYKWYDGGEVILCTALGP